MMTAVQRRALKLSENETLKFVQLYRNETILYDLSLTDYTNRTLRKEAVQRIVNGMDMEGFGHMEVLKKFKNLRNAYCQEMKKIEESKLMGVSNEYVPRVHWFETMDSFLRPYIFSKQHTNILRKSKLNSFMESTSSSFNDEYPEDEIEISFKQEIDPLTEPESDTERPDVEIISFHTLTTQPDDSENKKGLKRKHKTSLNDYTNELKQQSSACTCDMSTIVRQLQEIPDAIKLANETGKEEDMYDSFGKYIASLLRTAGITKALKIQHDITKLILNQITVETPEINKKNMLFRKRHNNNIK